MKKLVLSYSVLFLLFISCSEETKEEALFKDKIEKIDMESFKIPDSINTSLIIATCHDPENDTEIVFVYKDSSKASVKKIEFLPDRTSTQEELEILKHNEFRSKQNLDYVISEKLVDVIRVRDRSEAFLPPSRSIKRSDRD